MKTCIMKGHSFWRILIALCLVVSTMWVTAPPAEAAPPPTITSVTPGFGLICGGTVVTIAGNGLGGPLGTVTFNGVSATGISQVGSPPSYVCTTPASAAAGLATIVLTTFGGTTTNSTLFTYLIPVPTISNILPNSGPPEGGTVVTINGTNFTGATAVQFGGIDADGYTVNSATQITATNPATLNEGAVDVSVTTPVGTATLTLGFTYTNTVEVTSILPNAGPLGGGTTVTVVGANFYDGIILTIGGNSCTSVFLVDSSHLIATTPSGTAGAKDVGVGTATLTASFTYFDFPTIVSIAPASGSDLGGIVATITGTNFYSPATVTVGGNAATNITVDNNTQIMATTPAGTDGAADVSVTTNSGGPATLTGGFTYTLPIPAVIGCNPPDGSQSGGKLVTITGTNFFNTADLAVTFNGDPATGVMAVSQTSIICATPNYSPGVHVPGAVFVIVTCNGVSSVPMNAYTYLANPVITSISPSTGITTGGTNVTIFGANFINPPLP